MLAYYVIDTIDVLPQNTRSFIVRNKELDGDDDEAHILILRDFDYKFAYYQGVTYRVCQAEFEDDEQPFIKVWLNDPFKGYDGYEQITATEYPEDYTI